MSFARMCKIATAEFGLIPLQSDECAYITRRMDRGANGILHMEDFCQITDKLTAQKYNGSMEQVGKALRQYSSVPGLDVVRFFELAVFCYLSGNSDMHLKSFSLIRFLDGRYELAPAYDLVPVKLVMPADKEEMALTLNGKKSKLKRQDFERFGTTIGLTPAQIEKGISRMCEAAKVNVSDALACSFMTEEMNNRFLDDFNTRLCKLEG